MINRLHIARKRQRGKRGGKRTLVNKPNGANFSNLTYPPVNKTKIYNRLNERVTCMTINCRSAIKKDNLIGQMLREAKTDFAVLTETWYSDEKPHQYETSDFNQNGYNISVVNRKNRIGGGIALTYKNGIAVTELSNSFTHSFEFGIWKLVFKNITMHVIGVYRPPSLSTCTQFVADFFQKLEEFLPIYSNLMIIGDFNLHIQEEKTAITEFKNSLFSTARRFWHPRCGKHS